MYSTEADFAVPYVQGIYRYYGTPAKSRIGNCKGIEKKCCLFTSLSVVKSYSDCVMNNKFIFTKHLFETGQTSINIFFVFKF